MQLRPPETLDAHGDPGLLDAGVEGIPDRPAVFAVHLREGLPYLARTSLLRRRLRRLLNPRATPSRILNLRGLAAQVDYWLTGSRLESSLVFYDLTRQYFPDRYLDLTKLRMPPYLRVMTANPFPRTQVTTRISGRGLCYGPVRTRVAAEEFEAQMLDLFQVRRCQEDLAPAADHPGCIYGEMNKCLRPCQLIVTADEYRAEAERVVSFLETGGQSLIGPIESARARLSEELRFEDAARAHARIERILQVLRLRDELVSNIAGLDGIAVTRSAAPGSVELWFVLGGCWQAPVRFGFEIVEGKTVSIDQRLREQVSQLAPPECSQQTRQEHLALLARWFYSSWRDGEWLPFPDLAHVPYRKLVNAIHRVAS